MNSRERIDKVEADIDAYLSSKGIPSESIEVFLSMSAQEWQALPTEELLAIASEIQSHAFLVQSLYNKKQTIVEACKKKIQNTVGTKIHEYGVFGNAEKLRYAIDDNDSAKELDRIMEGPQLIVTRLSFLATRLESLSRTITELAKSKRIYNQ